MGWTFSMKSFVGAVCLLVLATKDGGAAEPTSPNRAAALDLLSREDGGTWIDAEKTYPMFIPESVLGRKLAIDQLPLRASDLDFIKGWMNPSGVVKPRCTWYGEIGGIGPSEFFKGKSFVQEVADRDLSIVGVVTSIEAGLYLWPEAVGSVVRVRVAEVLRDDDHVAQVGQE